MTTREAIYTSWVLAGEPTDLDPILATADYAAPEFIDNSSFGAQHYMRELTQAQRILANWKTSKNRPIRFQKFQMTRNVKLGLAEDIRTYDLVRINDSTFRIDAPPAWLTEELMSTAKITINTTDGGVNSSSEDMMVMQGILTAGGNMELYLNEDISDPGFTVAAYTGSLYLDRFYIEENTGIGNGSSLILPPLVRNITRISEAENGGNLKIVHSKSDLFNSSLTTGTPSEYYILGGQVFFDVYLEDPAWFVVEYQRLPATLATVDDDLDIPAEWHQAIIAIMEWREADRLMDTEKSMIKRSAVTTLINTLRREEEEEWMRNETFGLYNQTEEL